MKIMSRLKQAIFKFFEKEIMEAYGPVNQIKVVQHESNLVELQSEIRLDERDNQHYNVPASFLYDKALDKAKKQILSQVEQHIEVDERSVLESSYGNVRSIRLRLFVGVRK